MLKKYGGRMTKEEKEKAKNTIQELTDLIKDISESVKQDNG
jgi:hypothetical protein